MAYGVNGWDFEGFGIPEVHGTLVASAQQLANVGNQACEKRGLRLENMQAFALLRRPYPRRSVTRCGDRSAVVRRECHCVHVCTMFANPLLFPCACVPHSYSLVRRTCDYQLHV